MNENMFLSTDDYALCEKLKCMRFSGMAQALEEVLSDPNADLIPFREKVWGFVHNRGWTSPLKVQNAAHRF